MASITSHSGSGNPDFVAHKPTDHAAVGIMIGMIWLVVLAGFIPDMLRHVVEKAPPYQLVTHAHAFVAVSWLVLLTSQAAFIGGGDRARHMQVGRIGRWAGLALLVASVATAFSADLSRLASPTFRPQQLAFQLSHILVFAGLALWSFTSTRDPAAHKRLILLATLALVDAGASRWLGPELSELLGRGPFGQWAIRFPVPLAMIGAIGVYDLVTRKRLHPAFGVGASVIVTTQLLATWLYFQPSFAEACAGLLKAI